MQRLAVLAYGRILARPDPLFPGLPDQHGLAHRLALLTRCCRTLALVPALARLGLQTLPARAACLSVDGAQAEHAGLVLPNLQRQELSATFFIPAIDAPYALPAPATQALASRQLPYA